MKVSDYFLFILDDFNTKHMQIKQREKEISIEWLYLASGQTRELCMVTLVTFSHSVFTLLTLQYDSLTIDNVFPL